MIPGRQCSGLGSSTLLLQSRWQVALADETEATGPGNNLHAGAGPLARLLLLLLRCSRCLPDTAALPACRHKGVLQVWVMQAKDLHKQDVTGKADPFVELSTRVQQVEKTVSYQSRGSGP